MSIDFDSPPHPADVHLFPQKAYRPRRKCPKCGQTHDLWEEKMDDFWECWACGLSSQFRERVFVHEILEASTEMQNESIEWEVEV